MPFEFAQHPLLVANALLEHLLYVELVLLAPPTILLEFLFKSLYLLAVGVFTS